MSQPNKGSISVADSASGTQEWKSFFFLSLSEYFQASLSVFTPKATALLLEFTLKSYKMCFIVLTQQQLHNILTCKYSADVLVEPFHPLK